MLQTYGFEECQCCNKKLVVGELHSTKDSPTLDKIIPSLGYVKGNVIALCSRCNMIKQDATANEIQMVADFVRRITKERKEQ